MILNWQNEIPMAITVCNNQGEILYMNEKSKGTFIGEGGKNIIGQNLSECHSPSSQKKIQDMLETKSSNIYTVQKNGKKKMILQLPWFENNQIKGLVELSIELPENIPHYVRD